MNVPLDEVLFFDAISSSSTGAAVDADLTPTFAVYEEATDADIGVGGNMTKRTSLTGNYRGSFTVSAANGFELGKWYNVIGSATVGAIATKGVLMRFRIVAPEAVAGYPSADASKWAGVAVTGMPMPTYVQPTGLLAATFPGGTIANTTNITAGTIATVTTLTNLPSIPANWLTAAGIATGAIDADALAADALLAIANKVESEIIDETDSEKVLTAITDKIAAVNPDLSGLTVAAIASAVWSAVTRRLSDGTNIVLAKGVGVTGFNDLSAAQVNAEADTALADYDGPTNAELATALGTADDALLTQVSLVKAKTDLIPASPAAIGSAMTLTSGERDAIASAVFKLDLSTLTGEASRSLLNAIRKLRNKWSISGATLTVFAEDDTTPAYTQSLTATPGAAPITGIS